MEAGGTEEKPGARDDGGGAEGEDIKWAEGRFKDEGGERGSSVSRG